MASRVASGTASATRFDAEETARQVALGTAHAYLTVLVQHRVVEIDQRALDNARAHFTYTHTRLLGGIGNQLDDTRAGQDVATSEAELEQALAQLVQAQEALGLWVGNDGPLDADPNVELSPLSHSEPATISERGDVRASRQREQVFRHYLRNSWADFAPQLNGLFTPFYQHPPTATMPRLGWQLQLVLSFPLVTGGLRVGQIREREALLAESRAQLEGVVRQANSDVRTAMSAIERSDAALVSSLRAAELARTSMQMADAAYRAGATTNIEFIDAERRARDAEASAALAEDAARRARLDLLAAVGELP
jgi:outer membrane protein TolC